MKKHYAVYKDDEFICEGTKEECAEFINVKPSTIHFMSTPAYKKRSDEGNYHLIVIKVDEINENQDN